MKKLSYLLLLIFCISHSSCTMFVKGIVKTVVKKYDDHTDLNIGAFRLQDKAGKSSTFASHYAGKTVYLYIWTEKSAGLSDKQKDYDELKSRFARYPDVVFVNVYAGKDQAAWFTSNPIGATTDSYALMPDQNIPVYLTSFDNNGRAPFIIGKDGEMLAFKGPNPTDLLLVDYVLFQARNGLNGTQSAKQLIRGVNSNRKLKTKALRDWYANHFHKDPEAQLRFNVSSSN